MVQLNNQFKIIHLCLITFLELLFIFNNHQVMAMGNKHSNNNEISNDEEYSLYIQTELAIQNELTNFKLDNEKKQELLYKHSCIAKEIKKYNKRKNNNQLPIDRQDQPESSQQNINLSTEDDSCLSDEIQYINLPKYDSNKNAFDCPESSKKDLKNKGDLINV
ncbi:SVM family protein ['Fragaria x ananassa' phyllody phytoplasma]|uniref:SVM family protein n=1 Tax='Fragaria x ananassa' phyllody phytoplasma TaxID=2358428 RepID=A0ABS5K532_9MOLU|nr:SVM family protein ['Fragaria x ananassa' phyllody phytoplasma]MBS2126470.1 SVM family protein ['Fragaria x ananassa' phyllody phytoplasma]